MPKGFTSATASTCADTRWRRQCEKQTNIDERCSKGRHRKRLYSLKYDALISQFDSKQLHRNLIHQNYPYPCTQNIYNIGKKNTKHTSHQSKHRKEEEQTYRIQHENIHTCKRKESNFVDKEAFRAARKKENRKKFKSKRGFHMVSHCKKKKRMIGLCLE
eukprot:714734_1